MGMNLPYDENYLREMELWPFFEAQQRAAGQTLKLEERTEAPAPVRRGAETAPPTERVQAVRPPSAVRADRPGAAAPVVQPLDPERAARIAQFSWEELKTDSAACTACGLCKQRKQAVLGVGATDAPWLFIGEGPGSEEDEQGEPFVGQAGKLLDAMLAAAGLRRGREVYIANTVKCRPPGNRNPSPEESLACAPYLDRQIDLIKPKLIVALGKIAVTRLTGSEASMASMRGQLHAYRGIPLVATYHPAYLLRNLPDKVKAWEDLMLAKKTIAAL